MAFQVGTSHLIGFPLIQSNTLLNTLYLLSSTLFCYSFMKLIVIFVRLLHKTLACQKFIRQEFVQC